MVTIHLLRLPTALQSRIERRSIGRGTYDPCQTRFHCVPSIPTHIGPEINAERFEEVYNDSFGALTVT